MENFTYIVLMFKLVISGPGAGGLEFQQVPQSCYNNGIEACYNLCIDQALKLTAEEQAKGMPVSYSCSAFRAPILKDAGYVVID